MNSRVPDLAWLEDPEVFQVNREKAHSDHRFYGSVEAMEAGERFRFRATSRPRAMTRGSISTPCIPGTGTVSCGRPILTGSTIRWQAM